MRPPAANRQQRPPQRRSPAPPAASSSLLPSLRRYLRAAFRTGWTPLLLVALFGAAALWGGVLIGRRPLPTDLPPQEDRLEVAALNVGEGEASWIETPEHEFIVIGAGPPGAGARVAASLKDAGAKRIALLILPYPYAEAIGGVPELLAALPVKQALEPGGPLVNRQQGQMRDLLRQHAIPTVIARAGWSTKIDGARIQVLAPADPLLTVNDASANNSLVVRVSWGKTAFLWAGGIEREGEEALLAREPDLSAQWLRVGRFAGPDTSTPEFLRLVGPETAVVSVGPNGSGYPSSDTMKRLAATGARVFRTDSQPDPLVFYSDGSEVTGPF